MQHEKFAKRAAERLEAEADRLEEKSQWMKHDITAARANELRVAAHMVRDMAKAVTRAENEPWRSVMHGEYKTPGGKIVVADLKVGDGRLTSVEVSGDFFLEPPEALFDITGALEGAPANLAEEEFAASVREALGPDVEMIGFSTEAVARAVKRALA